MAWKIKFEIDASCKGCGEDIFPKSKVLIRCVVCTPQLTAAASLETGNQLKDVSTTGGLNDRTIGDPVQSATMDFCPDCFAGRVEIGNHKSFHNYQFIDCGGFPIFPATKKELQPGTGTMSETTSVCSSSVSPTIARWTAREHLFLLTAIETHGYGNWEDISRAINIEMNLENKPLHSSYRTPASVMEEYTNIFLSEAIVKKIFRDDKESSPPDIKFREHSIEHHTEKQSPKSPKEDVLTSTTITEKDFSLLEYWPLRNEFKTEYENEAELLVSELQYQPLWANNSHVGQRNKNSSQGSHSSSGLLTCDDLSLQDNDDTVDQELKLAHVEMYKNKLRERERRHRVSREHQLVNQFFQDNSLTYDGIRAVYSGQQKSLKEGSQKDRNISDVMERLKILAEFQEVSEHQVFMASMNKETEIKHRIKHLIRYRSNGIKNLSESLQYKAQKRNRKLNRKQSVKFRNQKGFQEFNSFQLSSRAMTNVNSHLVTIPDIEQLGQVTSEATFSLEGESVLSPASSIKSDGIFQQAVSTSSPTPLTKFRQNLPISQKIQMHSEKPIHSPQAHLASSSGGFSSFTITSFPGHEILSNNEKRLCTNLKLSPAQYISYKMCLLTNHLQKKNGHSTKPLNPSGLDQNDRNIIFNFLLRAGWITIL